MKTVKSKEFFFIFFSKIGKKLPFLVKNVQNLKNILRRINKSVFFNQHPILHKVSHSKICHQKFEINRSISWSIRLLPCMAVAFLASDIVFEIYPKWFFWARSALLYIFNFATQQPSCITTLAIQTNDRCGEISGPKSDWREKLWAQY